MYSLLDSQILQLWAQIQELQNSLKNPATKDSDRKSMESQIKIAAQALQEILEVAQAQVIGNACRQTQDTEPRK